MAHPLLQERETPSQTASSRQRRPSRRPPLSLAVSSAPSSPPSRSPAPAKPPFSPLCTDNIAELHRAVRDRQAQIRDQANEALDIVYATLTERDALNGLLRELDLNGISGRNPIFKPRVPRRRRDLAAEQLAGVRELLAVDPQVGNRKDAG